MLPRLSVDTWFIFGSFVYGFEGFAISLSRDGVEIEFSCDEESEFEELSKFFDDLISSPKKLIRSEIRFYIQNNSTFFNKIEVDDSIFLFTELSPTLSSRKEKSLRLLFRDLLGRTAKDKPAFTQICDAYL